MLLCFQEIVSCFRPFIENLGKDSVVKKSKLSNSHKLLKRAHSDFGVGQEAKNTPSPSSFSNFKHQVKDQPPENEGRQADMG